MPKRSRKEITNTQFSETAPHLMDAINKCLQHAKQHLYLNIGDIAEIMRLESKWILYKWLESGRIPFPEIPAFEAACGCRFITNSLVGEAGLLLVKAPDGSRAKARDLHGLQRTCLNAVGTLMDALDGQSPAEKAISALTAAMEELAYFRHTLATQEKAEK